jgi:dTDP-L-rhamnose 4-epimerase
MNILISGGAGFIGSNLAREIIKRGNSVTILDNLHPQIHGENPETSPLYLSIKDSVRFIRGSVTNRTDWENALAGADAVVNYAAETGTGQSMYEVSRYTDSNIGGTALLFDILGGGKHQVKQIVIASSRAVYGEGKYNCAEHGAVYPESRSDEDMRRGDFAVKCPFCAKDAALVKTTEDSLKHPSSLYGLTKQVQEDMTLLMGKALGISSCALRYQNVYGPGQSLSNPYTGILSIFSTRLIAGKDVNIFEDGKETRDFVYIDDVVDATVRALESEKSTGKVYNVGTGESVDVMTVAQTLAAAYSSTSKITVNGNYRVGDIRHNAADITLITRDLGFTPKVNFSEGIKLFASWVKGSKIPPDRYEESLEEMRKKGLYR